MRYRYTLALLATLVTGDVAWAGDGQLFFIQPTAVDQNTYIVSRQVDAMKIGFDLAVQAFNFKFPQTKCKPNINVNFDLHSDANLFEEVRRISNLPGKKVMIGLTRTNFARLAAHASAGTDMIGISSAAISDELRNLNPNFISVGTVYQKHWKATAKGLNSLNCTPDNTLGIFAFKDVWSGYYKKSFLGDDYKMVVDVDEFSSVPNIHNKVKCIFLGVSAPRSIQPLSRLLTMKWPGVIVGTHDWTYFSAEVRALLAEHPTRASRIYTTLIWHRDDTQESKKWADNYFGKTTLVEPFQASIYDSTLIALNYLCRDQNVLQFNAHKWKKFGTLRTYQGMSQSGNLETGINFVELPLVEWN